MKTLSFSLLLFCPLMLCAAIFKVGANKTYKTPNELYLATKSNPNLIADGDTIYIDQGEYRGRDCLAAWTANNLYIEGIGDAPKLYADGQYILGKGIWVASGDNIHVKNMAFYDAVVPDKNGAGIRLDGNGLMVEGCFFYNNENGILTSNSGLGFVEINNSEFGMNGHGDGFSHNIYVGRIEAFTLRGCYMHGAFIGHQIKSRAQRNIINYNRIEDGPDGMSSHLLDLPNGGLSLVIGNEFVQGANAENKRLIAYGAEGLTNNSKVIYIANNTFVNYRRTGTFIYAEDGAMARAKNNVFCGVGEVSSSNVYLEGNQHFVDIAEAKFKDPVNENFNLLKNSPLIDASVAPDTLSNFAIQAYWEFDYPRGIKMRPISHPLDVGAREYRWSTSIVDLNDKIQIYPNPSSDKLNILSEEECVSYKIFNKNGRLIDFKLLSQTQVDISNLPSGNYWIHLLDKNGNLSNLNFIKVPSN